MTQMAQSVWMRGSYFICEGMKSLLYRLATPSHKSYWKVITRPTFLQSSAWAMDNCALHLYQLWGISRGYIPYQINRASLISWTPRSIQLNVEIWTIIQEIILLPHCIQCASVSGSVTITSANAPMELREFRCLISALPFLITMSWSPAQNSVHTCRVATKCIVTSQEADQISLADRVRSGR